MRYQGVLRLAQPFGSVGAFGRSFPDQNKWLHKFSQHCKTDEINQLCKAIGYDGPLELLTMYMCLFAAKDLQRTSPSDVEQNQTKLSRALARFCAKHSLAPHPAVLCKSLLQLGLEI